MQNNNVKAISYDSKGNILGELIFENSTTFEAALDIQRSFTSRSIDASVVGGVNVNAERIVNVTFPGALNNHISIKVVSA
jgi:hypothetical protein